MHHNNFELTCTPAASRQSPGNVPAASRPRPGNVPVITTIWSQRPPRCNYDDLIPANAKLSLRRSGPSERPGVITTIWSQRLARCYYDDLVPASAQMSLRRSGPSDHPSVIATIGSQRLPRRKYALWGSAFQVVKKRHFDFQSFATFQHFKL